MLTTAERDAVLAGYSGYYVGFLTAITDWRAATVTEASYSGYARGGPITWNAAAGTTPAGGRQITNNGTVSGGQNLDAATTTLIGYALYAAASGGAGKSIGLMDADVPVTGTVSLASPGVITAPAHGLSANQRVFLMAAPGIPLPTGYSENTAYFVGTVPDANTLTLSTTTANANPVNTSSLGACILNPYTALSVAQNATPQFASTALVIQI